MGLWGFFNKNIKSSVIVNGSMSSSFYIYRGCRQGDPLFLYIFLLGVEVLAGKINNKIMELHNLIRNI